MDTNEKFGFALCLTLVAIIVLVVCVTADSIILEEDARHACLECGYPNYIVHNRNGYCVRVGSVVVPVEEACPRRVEQGKEKPQ